MTVLPRRAVVRSTLGVLGLGVLGLSVLAACATPEPTPTTPEAGTDAAAPVVEEAATGPECLIGDWYIAEDQMQAFYSAVSDSISVEGGTGLAFTDATYTYTPDFAIIVQVGGTEGEGSITGGVTGDYTANETEITTSHDVSDVSVIVAVSGITLDGTDLFGDFLSTSPVNSAPYECGAEGPILQFATGEGNPRVPIQLTPAN